MEPILKAEDARKAARGLQAEHRDKLREAGRRKLEEFRQRKYGTALKSDTLAHPYAPSSTLVVSSTTLAAPLHNPGPELDPLITVLLQQVEALMKERQNLQNENEQLKRENEQLHELVGYLSGAVDEDEACSPEAEHRTVEGTAELDAPSSSLV